MGLRYRKSVSAGPFRFKLSESGIGVSVGVPGFRIETGPSGHYVSISRNGTTYRKTFSSRKETRAQPDSSRQTPSVRPHGAPPAESTVGPAVSYISASAEQLALSSPDSLVDEINQKAGITPVWPLCAFLCAAAIVWSVQNADESTLIALASGGVAVAVCLVTLWLYYWDTSRRATVLFYQLDPASEQIFSSFANGLMQLASSNGKWRIDAASKVLDGKYHAGASSLLQRRSLQLGIGPLSRVRCNLDVPYIVTSTNTLYFCPDRIFVVTGRTIAAVQYGDLQLRASSTQFIEEQTLPSDAIVVGRTWRYVNKSGGPDRRFKDNPELPIVRYGELSLTTASGLNERLQFSRHGTTVEFCRFARELIDSRT
jgi:hypothetical protein